MNARIHLHSSFDLLKMVLSLHSILTTINANPSDHTQVQSIVQHLNAFCNFCHKYQPSSSSQCRKVNDVVQEEDEDELIPSTSTASKEDTTLIVTSDDFIENVFGFNCHQIFSCLRIPLFHESVEVRATTLRCFRYFIFNESIAKAFILNNIPLLVTKSLDIMLDNRPERLQAIRLIRKLLIVYPSGFPSSLTNSMTAISRDGLKEKDVMTRSCSAALAELCIRNPSIAVSTPGILSALTECILLNQSYNITESLTGVLLYLLNDLSIRQFMYEDEYLLRFVCTFTDSNYFPKTRSGSEHKNYPSRDRVSPPGRGHNIHQRLGGGDQRAIAFDRREFQYTKIHPNRRIERVARGFATEAKQSIMACAANSEIDRHDHHNTVYQSSKRAIVTTLRSWPGLIYFFRYTGNNGCFFTQDKVTESTNLIHLPNQFIGGHTCQEQQKQPKQSIHLYNSDTSSSNSSLNSLTNGKDHISYIGYPTSSVNSGYSSEIHGEKYHVFHEIIFDETNSSNPGNHCNGITCQLNAIQSIIETLYMPNQDILDLLFELLNLPTPCANCDDFDKALFSCSIIPGASISRTTPMTSDHQMSVFLSSTTAIPSSLFQNDWHIYDGFVASEGKSLIPPLANNRNNLYESYMSLLLYSLISYGIIDALETVIIRIDSLESSIRATLLLGEILIMSSKLLPERINRKVQTLETLMLTASSNECSSPGRTIATSAIAFLNKVQTLKKHKPKYYSMYLKQLVEFADRKNDLLIAKKMSQSINNSSLSLSDSASVVDSVYQNASDNLPPITLKQTSQSDHHHHRRSVSNSVAQRSVLAIGSMVVSSLATACAQKSGSTTSLNGKVEDERYLVLRAFDDSKIFTSDRENYDWILISNILTLQFGWILKLSESELTPFLDKLLHYFKPSSSLFSVYDHTADQARIQTVVLCDFVNFLVKYYQATRYKFAYSYLNSLVSDIIYCLNYNELQQPNNINQSYGNRNSSSIGNILSHHKLLSTLSHAYFLMIGQLSSQKIGLEIMEKLKMKDVLNNLIHDSHDTYVKLIVSSLDYTGDNEFSRSVLTDALNSKTETSQIYATNFLRILVRLEIDDFHQWGIQLLLNQLNSSINQVSKSASEILLESLELKYNLEKLIDLNPIELLWSRQKKCHNSALIITKFTSNEKGLQYLKSTQHLDLVIKMWTDLYNLKYVKITEDILNDCLTQHYKSSGGSYGRKTERKYADTDCYLPPHLFSELSQTTEGIQVLKNCTNLDSMVKLLANPETSSELSRIKIKAALWAVGHIASTEYGLELVESSICDIAKLTESSTILSIRGTSYYALNLIAKSQRGIDLLQKYNWTGCIYTSTDGCLFPGLCLPMSLGQIFTIPKIQSGSDIHFLNSVEPLKTQSGFVFHNESNCLLCNGCKPSRNITPEMIDIRKEVLRLLSNLTGTPIAKAVENGLLNLKQRYPNSFQDICLYSEVIHQLSAYKFPLSARRLMQELFLDLNIDELRDYANQILGKKRM